MKASIMQVKLWDKSADSWGTSTVITTTTTSMWTRRVNTCIRSSANLRQHPTSGFSDSATGHSGAATASYSSSCRGWGSSWRPGGNGTTSWTSRSQISLSGRSRRSRSISRCGTGVTLWRWGMMKCSSSRMAKLNGIFDISYNSNVLIRAWGKLSITAMSTCSE